MAFHQAQNSLTRYNYNGHIYKRNPSWPPHFHQNFEVIYIYEGSVRAVIGGKESLLHPGDFALALSNEVHQYEPLEQTKAWICTFSGDYVPHFQKEVAGKTGDASKFHCDDTTLQYLKENLMFMGTPEFYILTAGLNILCSAYLQQVMLTTRGFRESSLLNRASDYISENFRKRITLAQTAHALGYDYHYFSKAFHATFGVGFNDYLNTVRFNAAAEALLASNDSITTIALDSGFQSVRSFNEVFSKKAGTTPSQYRKSGRN